MTSFPWRHLPRLRAVRLRCELEVQAIVARLWV